MHSPFSRLRMPYRPRLYELGKKRAEVLIQRPTVSCPLMADFVAEVADESRKLRRRSAGAVAYHSLRWKRWLEATALAPSTRLQRDLTLIPRMGRPAVAAGRRAWPACGGSARWLPA